MPKAVMRIMLSAIFTKFYSFRNMTKHNLCKKKNIILGSPPKRATWKEKSCFLGKCR